MLQFTREQQKGLTVLLYRASLHSLLFQTYLKNSPRRKQKKKLELSFLVFGG